MTTKNVMRKVDLDTYYEELSAKLRSGAADIALNKDRAHNTTVMRLMFDTSDSVCMYCGEMSVFREPFYRYITDENPQGEGVETLGESLKRELQHAMARFLARDSAKLNIILEKRQEKIPDDLIFGSEFIDAIKNEKVRISYLRDDLVFEGLSHFSFADKIIRMEKDMREHSAICAVNPPKESFDNLRSHFENLETVTADLYCH